MKPPNSHHDIMESIHNIFFFQNASAALKELFPNLSLCILLVIWCNLIFLQTSVDGVRSQIEPQSTDFVVICMYQYSWYIHSIIYCANSHEYDADHMMNIFVYFQTSQVQAELALLNPDYVLSSTTYPPKILLTISPRPVTVQGKLPDDDGYIGVNGIIEDLGKFTLRFPSHPSYDQVHVAHDQPKGKYIHSHQSLICVTLHSCYTWQWDCIPC